MNDTNTMTQVTQLTNGLSAQSDRWLFLFCLVMMGLGAMLVVRYLVTQHATLINQYRTDTKEYQEGLKQTIKDGMQVQKDLTSVLKENALAMEENTETLKACRNR